MRAKEAREELGITRHRFDQLVREGYLLYEKEEGSWRRFDPEEVHAAKDKWPVWIWRELNWISLKRAAEALSVPYSTARKRMERGDWPSVKVFGTRRLWLPLLEVDHFGLGQVAVELIADRLIRGICRGDEAALRQISEKNLQGLSLEEELIRRFGR